MTTIVQVSRIGSKLTMDMTVYFVEKEHTTPTDTPKVKIQLAFALATVYNTNPAVVKTVVEKLKSCVRTELAGLDWGTD